jgi:phosphatidylglycerophosphate synthase
MAKVNPNTLTIISLIAGILAGISYVGSHISPWFFLLGGGFVMISGTADSLDGIMARMYDRV